MLTYNCWCLQIGSELVGRTFPLQAERKLAEITLIRRRSRREKGISLRRRFAAINSSPRRCFKVYSSLKNYSSPQTAKCERNKDAQTATQKCTRDRPIVLQLRDEKRLRCGFLADSTTSGASQTQPQLQQYNF